MITSTILSTGCFFQVKDLWQAHSQEETVDQGGSIRLGPLAKEVIQHFTALAVDKVNGCLPDDVEKPGNDIIMGMMFVKSAAKPTIKLQMPAASVDTIKFMSCYIPTPAKKNIIPIGQYYYSRS